MGVPKKIKNKKQTKTLYCNAEVCKVDANANPGLFLLQANLVRIAAPLNRTP
jgi:hypothetical protein